MIRRGSHVVTCKHCSVEGVLRVGATLSNGKVKVRDYIEHAETCPMYVRPQPRHLKQKRWVAQEKRANALVGARETLASGAVGLDGDGRLLHEWRTEAKQTTSDRYLLTQAVWRKLVHGALLSGEEPLLHVELLGGKVRKVIVRSAFFNALSTTEASPADPKRVNRKSYRISKGAPCAIVPLEPEGVEMSEGKFKKLKERYENQ